MSSYLPFGRTVSELLGFREVLKNYIVAKKTAARGKFIDYEELCLDFAKANAEYPWEFPGGKKLGEANAYRLALYFLHGYCVITHLSGLHNGTRVVFEFDESPEEVNEWCNVNEVVASEGLKKKLSKELEEIFKSDKKTKRPTKVVS
jgi:hypothetical protein